MRVTWSLPFGLRIVPKVPERPAIFLGTAAADFTISGGHAFAHEPTQRIFPPAFFSTCQ